MILIGTSARVSVNTHKLHDLAKPVVTKEEVLEKRCQFSIQILIRKYCALVLTHTHTHIYTHSLLLYICDTDLIIQAHTAIYS